MSQIRIIEDGIELSGEMTFDNIRKIEFDLLKLLQKCEKFVNIRFDNVEKCDSSLLALLMVLVSFTNKKGIGIKLHNAPSQLISIARLSGLDSNLKLL